MNNAFPASGQSVYGIDFTRALPDPLKNDENIFALGRVIAGELQENIRMSRHAVIYARLDELDESLLDILAYDFCIDWYDVGYSLEEKRKILKNSIKVHKYKGTKYAVETALGDIYPGAKVSEWFEYGGNPFMFKIIIPAAHDYEKLKKVIKNIMYYKNLRSHLENIIYRPVINDNACFYTGVKTIFTKTIITAEVKMNVVE